MKSEAYFGVKLLDEFDADYKNISIKIDDGKNSLVVSGVLGSSVNDREQLKILNTKTGQSIVFVASNLKRLKTQLVEAITEFEFKVRELNNDFAKKSKEITKDL